MKIGNLLLIGSLTLIAACGLATSDSERIERAASKAALGQHRAAIIELKNVLASNPDNADARLLLAEVSLNIGDIMSAEKELDRATALGAVSPESVKIHYRILLARRKFSDVLAELGQGGGSLEDADISLFRGQALLGIGSYAPAEKVFRDWLGTDPDSVEARMGLASSLAEQSEWGEARAILSSVLSDFPNSVSAHQALATIDFATESYNSAEEGFKQASIHTGTNSNPIHRVTILASLAETQLILRKIDDAERTVISMQEVMPSAPPTLFLSAKVASEKGDYDEAIVNLQRLLQLAPDDTRVQLALAVAHSQKGNFGQAEGLLAHVVALSPDNLHARKLLAQVQLKLAKPEGAIEALAPFLEEDALDSDALNLLALANLRTGNSAEAATNLLAANESDPDNPDRKLDLAEFYLGAGEYDLAIDLLNALPSDDRVVIRRERLLIAGLIASKKLDEAQLRVRDLMVSYPANPDVINLAGAYYAAAGDSLLAMTTLNEGISANPDNVDLLLSYAGLLARESKYDQSELLFTQVLKLDQGNIVASLGAAELALNAGEMREAESYLVSSSGVFPYAPEPKIALAKVFLQEGRNDDALDMARQAAGLGVRGARLIGDLGNVMLAVGALDEALVQFEKSAAAAPESSKAQFNLARGLLALDRTVPAKRALERALELDPSWLQVKLALVLVDLRQGLQSQALIRISELREDHPGSLEVMVLEGEVSFRQKDYVRAADAFHRAVANGAGRSALLREFQSREAAGLSDPIRPVILWLENNPEDTRVRLFVAQYYQMANAPAEATSAYEAILEMDPQNAVALNNLAWQYQTNGDLKKALELARQAYEIDSSSGSIADTLAWILRDLGEFEESTRLLREATRLSPSNSIISYHLAVVLAQSGSTAEAREILERLVSDGREFSMKAESEKLLREL